MTRRIDLCRQIFEIQPAYKTKKYISSLNSNSVLYNVVDMNVKFLKHKQTVEAVTYKDLFSLANFNPSFDGKITSKLLFYIPQNQTEIEIIIIHLLFASVSLLYFYDNSMEIQNCADFFQLICKYPNSLYQDLIASAISEVYLICISLDFDTHYDLILSTLSEYINTINLNPTNLMSRIIDSIEIIATKTDYEKNSHGPTFLTFLTTVIADHTEFFTNDMYNSLFKIIQPYILKLHEYCLNIFYLIHKNLDLTLISEFINNFYESICTLIESDTPYYDVLSIDSLELELEKSPMYQMNFPQRKTFENGFILPDIVQKSGESKNILNPNYQNQVSLIFKIISNIESAYIALLFKFITKVKISKDSEYYFDFCGLLVLYLLIGRIQIEKSDFPIPEFIGNPKISTSKIDNLYSMRFFFLYLILINFNQDLDNFLLQMAHFPLIFSDYLQILMNLMIDLIPYIHNHTNIIQTLASISIQLQMANFKADKNISEIESCRLTLFKLFQTLLAKDDIMILFFANPLFTSHIISLLYEENVREFALNKLCRYISISQTLPCLISIINPLFDQISNYSISDDRQQSILLMIIKSINNNTKNIQLFVDFTDQLTIVIKSLTKTQFSEDIVLEIIKLYVTMSQETDLKQHWVEDLEICYNQLDLHDERSFIGMESLLLGKNVDSIVLNVEIKNDFVFPIIFRIFYRKKEDLMQYFISLCNYSNVNARLMHFGKLDLEIIKILEQDSSDDELIELFYHISSVSSSPQIVQQFLALFSLIHKRFVRPRSNYVNLLSKLLIDIQGKPEMSLSLSDRHEFNFSNENNQFAISFWVNLASSSSGTIISLSRNENDEEKLLMINEKDFLCKGYRINTKIAFGKWIFVVLSLKNSTMRIYIDSDQLSNIKISQNVRNFNKLIIGNLTDDNDNSSQISNVVISDLLSVQDIQEYYRKGPRSMFQFENPIFAVSYSLISKIQKNVDRKFANILLRYFRVNILLPLFAQLDLEMIDFKSLQYLTSKYSNKNDEKTNDENKEKSDKNSEKSQEIKSDKNQEKINENSSEGKSLSEIRKEKSDISQEKFDDDEDKTDEEIQVEDEKTREMSIKKQLEKRKKLDELIINELLTKSKNDQIDVSNLTILPNDVTIIDIISLLSLALHAGEKEEMDFVSNDGAKILSHLLTSLNHNHLTVDCYKSLFLVVETSLTEDIKNTMMKDILLNFNIWRFSPDQTQIYSYLSDIIFEYNPNLICQNISLNKLLNTIRIYFWYDKLEMHNDDRKVSDISDVRKILFNFGLNIAWHSITMKSFKKIISHIITVPDDRQRKDMLQFLLGVTSHHSVINNLGTQVLTFSKQLNSLFNSDDEEIIFLTISSISALFYCFPEMKPKFVIFVTSLDQIILQRKFGDVFLQKIVSILPAFPELFKFVTFVSMNSRNNLVYEAMEPSVKFTTIDYWYKYSIVHAINEEESQIFTFLCKCKLENTFEFAMMTDLICRSLNKDQYHYLSLLISSSLHFAFDSRAKTPLMNNLVNIAFHFIFFHDGFAKTNKNIEYLFDKSPFSDKERMIMSSRSNPNIASFKQKRSYKKISKSNPNLADFTDSVDDSDEKLQRFFLDDSEAENSFTVSGILSENLQQKINENSDKMSKRIKEISDYLSEHAKNSEESKNSQNSSLLNESQSTDNISENDKTPNSPILNESENIFSESERFISDSNISESDLSEQINISEVEKLQLNITDQLIKKYRFVPTKEQFSLRISDKKGKWEDFSLSLLLLKIFSVYKLDNVHSFSSIVLYFLHQADDVGKQIANDLYRDNVKVLSDDNSGYFVMFRDKITGKFTTNSFNILNDINKFNNFNYNDLFLAEIKNIRKNINYLSLNSIKILPNSLPPEIFNFEEKISNFYNEIQSFKNENRKKWHIFWSNASQGPFMNKNEQKITRFKRDESLFYCMCPWRLKINRKFDDHTKESIARELGNSQKQEEAMKMFKEKENEQKVTLPKLLEVVDTKTKEKIVEGNENQISEFECELITIKKCRQCKFIICKSFLMIENLLKKTKIIYFHEISRILQRPKFQRITAIEIFTKSGRSYFVNFTQKTLPKVIKSLTNHLTNENILIQKTSNFPKFFAQQELTEKWLNYELSNFEYLMLINVFSGRSFSDSSQYPFMPWTLREFKKSNLDLEDISNYRDLTLPIGQIDKERYEMLKQRVDLGQTNFLYSSFCVSPLSLFLWLIRTEPFTTLHTDMQSGRFDVPSRIFKSISEAFKLATTRINDYRELIPEFFYFPEFLLNLNGFDFGNVRNEKVDDVKLPPWSRNAVEFVYKMRESLESDYVSENIHNWIDFYFGVDQKKENNLFCETCYSGIWTKELLKNKEERETIEAQMTLLGQFPQQIFTQKHPKRKPRKDVFNDMKENTKLKISENKIKSASINDHFVTILSEDEVKVIEIYPDNFKILRSYFNENVEIILNESLYLTKTYSIQSINNTNDKIVDLVNVSCYALKRKSSIVVSYDSILNIFRENLTMSVPFYGESIKCCDVSTEYGLVICGTASFSVNICKLNDGSKIRTLDLDFCPNFVLITNKWGFIYCLDKTGNMMASTLNGTVFMRNNHFGKEITCLTSFSTNFGFDYVAIAYEDGKIVVFDAFYGMNEGNKQSFRCYSKVVALKYLYDLKMLCAVTENGFVHFFYVQL